MFEQKITPRDIMTGPVYTVQLTDRMKRVIALPGECGPSLMTRARVDGSL